jgi:hypothetical protein
MCKGGVNIWLRLRPTSRLYLSIRIKEEERDILKKQKICEIGPNVWLRACVLVFVIAATGSDLAE